LPLFSPLFLRICIVLLRAAQSNCPGYAVLLSPKQGAILCQTVDSHFTCHVSDASGPSKHSKYTVTVHTSCVPQPLNFLVYAPLVLESVNVWRTVQLSPTVHKGLCYFVSVFPSFTYLTSAVLSFVVFPVVFFPSASTPAEQWAISIVRLSDPLISMSMLTDRFDCDEAFSINIRGIMLDRDKQITPRFTESKHLQWTYWVKEFPNWSELRL